MFFFTWLLYVLGSLGTAGRRCNRTSHGSDGCDILCCGRGYDTTRVLVKRKCNCKFEWCCVVKCEECREWKDIYTCKPGLKDYERRPKRNSDEKRLDYIIDWLKTNDPKFISVDDWVMVENNNSTSIAKTPETLRHHKQYTEPISRKRFKKLLKPKRRKRLNDNDNNKRLSGSEYR